MVSREVISIWSRAFPSASNKLKSDVPKAYSVSSMVVTVGADVTVGWLVLLPAIVKVFIKPSLSVPL